MGEVQIWQVEGLGTDEGTLERVLHTFKTEGIQGVESQMALIEYVGRLSDGNLRDMCEIDKETALQLFVDCFGVHKAFDMAIQILGYVTPETAQRMGWVSPEAYVKVVGKYEERAKKSEEQIDKILSDYTRAAQMAEDAEEKISSLQDELAHCKADLYDFYAKAGKLPDYERR